MLKVLKMHNVKIIRVLIYSRDFICCPIFPSFCENNTQN